MNVVFVIRSLGHFSYYETIMRSLCRRGHRVELLCASPKKKKNEHKPSYFCDRAIRDCESQLPGFRFVGTRALRREGRHLLRACRELRTYASYLRRRDQSSFYLDRWERHLSPGLQRAVQRPAVRWLLRFSWTQRCLGLAEWATKPDMTIMAQFRAAAADVVVAGPANLPYSDELEYLKAAKALGIPTVIPVLSWDNLTTKGLFHVRPDLMLVWNQAHYAEARRIHRMPADRLVITGSPFFDKWFEERGSSDRQAFCAKMGLDPGRPFLLYLGSSSNISQDETWLVRELNAALARDARPEIRNLQVLVRPHPANWQIYRPLAAEGMRIWPDEGALPDSEDVIQDFHDMLRYSVATVGLNTSAMIDAVIADRPTICIQPPCYTATQDEAIHFQRLRDAGVFDLTDGAAGAVERVAAVLEGTDERQGQRRRFVLEFVRPWGLERSAGALAARAIELAAQHQGGQKIERELAAPQEAQDKAMAVAA